MYCDHKTKIIQKYKTKILCTITKIKFQFNLNKNKIEMNCIVLDWIKFIVKINSI